MSLLPKALAAVLAPMELPMTHTKPPPQPLREIIIHGQLWASITGLCGRRPPKASNNNKKTDEDPIEITSRQGSTAIKIKTVLRPADLV